jgi:hypothetical protein
VSKRSTGQGDARLAFLPPPSPSSAQIHDDQRCPSHAPCDEALAAPLRSFRSWLLRIECERCGRERYAAETHMTIAGLGDRRIGDLLARP